MCGTCGDGSSAWVVIAGAVLALAVTLFVAAALVRRRAAASRRRDALVRGGVLTGLAVLITFAMLQWSPAWSEGDGVIDCGPALHDALVLSTHDECGAAGRHQVGLAGAVGGGLVALAVTLAIGTTRHRPREPRRPRPGITVVD